MQLLIYWLKNYFSFNKATFYKNERFHIFIGEIQVKVFIFEQSLSLHWIHSTLGHPDTILMRPYLIQEWKELSVEWAK